MNGYGVAALLTSLLVAGCAAPGVKDAKVPYVGVGIVFGDGHYVGGDQNLFPDLATCEKTGNEAAARIPPEEGLKILIACVPASAFKETKQLGPRT